MACVIVALLLLLVAIVLFGVRQRRCWSSIRPVYPHDGSNAESLLQVHERIGRKDKILTILSLSLEQPKRTTTDIEMARSALYRAPPIKTPDPDATSAMTNNKLPTHSALRELPLDQAVTENKPPHVDDKNQSDRMGSEDSSLLLGCAISSPSSISADGTNDNEPMGVVLESLPEHESMPLEQNNGGTNTHHHHHGTVGSTTDEEHYYASDEYSTSSDENQSPTTTNSNATVINSQSLPGPPTVIGNSSVREESLGTLFATSSSEEEGAHWIQRRPRLPSFGKERPHFSPSATHPKVMSRGYSPKAAAASSDSDLDTISGSSI